MNDGHIGAEVHHILDDVRREDDDDLFPDFGEQIVKAIALAGVEPRRGLIHNGLPLLAIDDALEKSDVVEHVLRGNARINTKILREIAQPTANFFFLPQDVHIAEHRSPAVGFLERRKSSHQGGLARAVRAKQPIHPPRDGQGDVIEGFHTIRVGLGQTLNFQFHLELQPQYGDGSKIVSRLRRKYRMPSLEANYEYIKQQDLYRKRS